MILNLMLGVAVPKAHGTGPGTTHRSTQSVNTHVRVRRAGLKLEAALEHWAVDVRGLRCLDAGVSTGGFTDCLLQRGAAHVVGVDVGYGQVTSYISPKTKPQT